MWSSRLPHHRFWAIWYFFIHIFHHGLCSQILLTHIFSFAASAFSERYLGPKTDSRVYTVKTFQYLNQRDFKWAEFWVMECLFVFLQMANLAHRAGQLLQKQYLIIHPTADGKMCWCEQNFNWEQPLMCLAILLLSHRKGSLPAHGQIYQSFNQREGQLHSTGELLGAPPELTDNYVLRVLRKMEFHRRRLIYRWNE